MLFQRLWAHVHQEIFRPKIRNKVLHDKTIFYRQNRSKRIGLTFIPEIREIELTFVPEIREKVTHPKNGQNGGFAARSIAHNNQMVSINVSHDFSSELLTV